jgi:CDP-glycerol glycerophosphotransferase (TagB/SpsB family)
MDNHIADGLANDLHDLYLSDPAAGRFLDWAADRKNDAAETSVDRISSVIDDSYSEARVLAKRLCETGAGNFIIGRKGWKSRISWKFSLRSLGQAARGDNVELEEVDQELVEDSRDQVEAVSSADAANNKKMTISEAKQRLAESLGVSQDSIEIIIKA